MAFFDEVGKKISQTSQGVAQKTKNIAETMELNSKISDEEKNINNIFIQIGKTYYETYGASPDRPFIQLVGVINDSKSKIVSYAEQIKQIKGITRCPKCGGEVPYGATFCSSCGSPMNIASEVAQPISSDIIVCGNCGAQMSADSVFCINCGNKIERLDVISQEIELTPIAEIQSITETEPEVLTCLSCGSQVSDDAAFCLNCGQKLLEKQEV